MISLCVICKWNKIREQTTSNQNKLLDSDDRTELSKERGVDELSSGEELRDTGMLMVPWGGNIEFPQTYKHLHYGKSKSPLTSHFLFTNSIPKVHFS